jgi:hypothetical protein
VWRVLFVTRNYELPGATADAWSSDFAHFDVAGAEYLAQEATQLLLVGLDTPSVDHPTQSPICHGAHGALYSRRIAILENLNLMAGQQLILANSEAMRGAQMPGAVAACDPPDHQEESTVFPHMPMPLAPLHVLGTVMTVFIPSQCFPDSKGCAVVFFPHATAETSEH